MSVANYGRRREDMAAMPPRALRVRPALRFVPLLRPALYALLVLSALFTFWAGGDIAGRSPPPWMQVVAPTMFAIFIVIFSVYRLSLVRARKYPAAMGLFQIGLGVLIWALLLPGSRQRIEPRRTTDEVATLISSPDPRVRALASEVAGYRPDGWRYSHALIERLADADPRVRERARASLVRLAGEDPAPGLSGEAAQAKFRELARRKGWLP